MSKIQELGPQAINLPNLVVQYEADLDQAAANLKISGKTLDAALREQGTWPGYYSQRRAELKAVMKHLDARANATRGTIARKYENYSIKLGERLLNTYIDSDPEFLRANDLYLEIAELYDKYDAVCEAFTVRGYALRDLTTARSNSIQDT
jgi:hypothetical protein